MGDSILYYPTIEFRNSDYKWLWTASLFWEKIYRIVPGNFILDEPGPKKFYVLVVILAYKFLLIHTAKMLQINF